MSADVSVREKDNGKHEVRWRQAVGTREDGSTIWRRRGRTLTRARDAERFAATVRRRLELSGVVRLDEDIPTLGEFVETWWRVYAMPNLARNTRASYLSVWEVHALDRLGELRLQAITPGVIDMQLLEPMRRARVGDPTIRKTLAMLRSVMRLAALHHSEVVTSNPVALIKPPAQARREVDPVWPGTVEEIRRRLGARDATMVSVLAYAGLRPGELLGLRWGDVRPDKLVVERAIALGEERSTKTGRGRVVDLLAPLAHDLREWRMESGRPGAQQTVFPRPDGQTWRDHDWRNWRRRTYQPAARAVGLASKRPYDLRGSFVSLLIHEGRTVVDVAEQAGHTPETCLRFYARMFRDAPPPDERVKAEQAIAAARNADQQRLAL